MTSNVLKYLEKESPKLLIDLLNSDFEQTATQYNSFCRLINNRLHIQNHLHFDHELISPGLNRETRLTLMNNVRNLNSAFDSLSSLLDQSPFKKVEKGNIISYDFHAWTDISIKLTKDQINDYIKQIDTVLKELEDFKIKYRINE